MTWGNPPKFKSDPPKKGKIITPEMLAASGSEDGNQAALFCWSALPEVRAKYPQLEWMFAIPNGGSRHIAEATKFVGTGTRAGVPDIFLSYATTTECDPSSGYFGLFIEMKVEERRNTKDGGLSQEQLDWISALKQAGYAVAVCYSWTEARDTLIAYLEGKL